MIVVIVCKTRIQIEKQVLQATLIQLDYTENWISSHSCFIWKMNLYIPLVMKNWSNTELENNE